MSLGDGGGESERGRRSGPVGEGEGKREKKKNREKNTEKEEKKETRFERGERECARE